MKVIPKTISNFVVTLGEKSVILNINESLEVEYLLTENSNNNVLQDLVEAKAYATALLYLNETYKLVTNNKLFKENKVEDYYNDCNSLLKENVVIVEEKGIPLVSIQGYNIYESDKGILRGNGKKKLKESFNNKPIDEFTTGKWKVTLTDDGGNRLIVSFIDMSQDKKKFPEGQFVCSYYLDTLLGKNDLGPSIENMEELRLWNDIPAWTVEGEDLIKIVDWLKSFSKDKSSLDESDIEINVDDLVWDLVEFMKDFDTYDFNDNYNSDEEAYEETLKSLNSKSEINGIINHLKELIEDTPEENHTREENLITRLKLVIPTLNEDSEGTQVGDIAPKVDQDMNGKSKKKKEDKKYYDILLSGIDESMDMVLNKGFMKNINGQYERDGYILVKENDKFIAVRKDKLVEDYDGQMSIDEKGLPELPHPYSIRERNDGLYQMTSSHPYDDTDYAWALSTDSDINGLWKVYEPNPDYSIYMDVSKRPSQYLFMDAVKGWAKALELLQKLDATKESHIDRS